MRETPTRYRPQKGHTFLFQDDGDGHLYIIITDPFSIEDDDDQRVVVVNFSWLDAEWRKCKLDEDEHCFLSGPTCIKYEYMKVWRAEKIRRAVMTNNVPLYRDVSTELLRKIICSAFHSRQVDPKKFKHLNNNVDYEDYCGDDFDHLNS